MKAILFLLWISLCASFDASKYQNNLQLDPKYKIYWTKDGDTMNLALEVQTTGWVGFGIGEPTSGSMPGADIMVATVSGAKSTINDFHAVAKAYPLEDDCSNWVLVNAEEAQGTTIVEIKRYLDTGDLQDRPFTESTRVIIAWGNDDNLQYHESNRKATTVQFWGTADNQVPNLPSWEFINVGYTVPKDRTTYEEVLFNVTSNVDVSVVAMEAILTSHYVHHYLVYASEDNTITVPEKVTNLLWGWAPGVDYFILPSFAGFKFGPTAYKMIRIQIHYDNPDGDTGKLDSSGVRLYYDTKLRPIEAGVIELGDPTVANRNGIPAGQGSLEFEYDCPSSCTQAINQTLYVFGNTLHMHQIGKQMWGKQWRNGQLVRETNRIDFWDFALQQLTHVNHTIEPGDRISTHCVYNRQSTDVAFSLGSNDEMCIQFIYYWPKVNKRFCGFYVPDEAPMTSNFTLCGSDPIMGMNPTVMDPSGGDVIVFGTQNPSSFVCKVPTVNQGQNEEDSGAQSLALLIIAILFLML